MSRRRGLWATVLEVALLLVAVMAIGWEVLHAVRTAKQLDQTFITFRTLPDAYFRIADHLESSIGELNDILFRYTSKHDRTDWESFQRKSQELSNWLANEKALSPQTKVMVLQPAQIT